MLLYKNDNWKGYMEDEIGEVTENVVQTVDRKDLADMKQIFQNVLRRYWRGRTFNILRGGNDNVGTTISL